MSSGYIEKGVKINIAIRYCQSPGPVSISIHLIPEGGEHENQRTERVEREGQVDDPWGRQLGSNHRFARGNGGGLHHHEAFCQRSGIEKGETGLCGDQGVQCNDCR